MDLVLSMGPIVGKSPANLVENSKPWRPPISVGCCLGRRKSIFVARGVFG